MSELLRAAGAPPNSGTDGAAGEGAEGRGPGDRKAGAHLDKPASRGARSHLKSQRGRRAGAHLDKSDPRKARIDARLDGLRSAACTALFPPPLALDRRRGHWTEEAILAEIRRVAALVDAAVLRYRMLAAHSPLSHRMLCRRFGSWRAALERAGLADRAAPARPETWSARQRISRHAGDAELLEELRRVARLLGRDALRWGEIKAHSRFGPWLLDARFGSWAAAVKRAGLRAVSRRVRHSDQDCFDNLRRAWLYWRRPPRGAEMGRAPSTIDEPVYRRRWGSWTRALEAFVARVNATPGDPLHAAAREWAVAMRAGRGAAAGRRPPLPPAQRRTSATLRHAIMQRDRFRCVLCGASPATDPACTLEIDHILPFSRGGRTVEDNLRTLCHACNAGRGPRACAGQGG